MSQGGPIACGLAVAADPASAKPQAAIPSLAEIELHAMIPPLEREESDAAHHPARVCLDVRPARTARRMAAAPLLAPGQELIYRGEFVEENLGQNYQRSTRYRLDASMVVLDASAKDWHAAFLTTLRLDDGRVVSERFNSLRLEQAKVELQGRVRGAEQSARADPAQGAADARDRLPRGRPGDEGRPQSGLGHR